MGGLASDEEGIGRNAESAEEEVGRETGGGRRWKNSLKGSAEFGTEEGEASATAGVERDGGEGDKGEVAEALATGEAEFVRRVPFVLAKVLARRSAAASASLRADEIGGLSTPVFSLPLRTGAAGEGSDELLELALAPITLTSGTVFALNLIRIFSNLSSKFNTTFGAPLPPGTLNSLPLFGARS